MANEVMFHEIEIDSKQISLITGRTMAYVTDLKCFVYKSNDGELSYFHDTPKFRKAHQDAFQKAYKKTRPRLT